LCRSVRSELEIPRKVMGPQREWRRGGLERRDTRCFQQIGCVGAGKGMWGGGENKKSRKSFASKGLEIRGRSRSRKHSWKPPATFARIKEKKRREVAGERRITSGSRVNSQKKPPSEVRNQFQKGRYNRNAGGEAREGLTPNQSDKRMG